MLFVNSWAHPPLAMYNGSDTIQDKKTKIQTNRDTAQVSNWHIHETDQNSTVKALKTEPTLESQKVG